MHNSWILRNTISMMNHDGEQQVQTSPHKQPARPEKLYRLHEIEPLTGLKKSSIYAGMKAGTFPTCIRLSVRAVAWRESDIAAWQANRQSAD